MLLSFYSNLFEFTAIIVYLRNMKYIKHIFLTSIALLFASLTNGNNNYFCNISAEHLAWCDSVYNSMTLRERIGQLFIAGALTTEDEKNKTHIARMVNEYKVGGFILSKGTAGAHLRLTEYAQSLSKVPLMITIDGEWGLSMRLTDTHRFPKNIVIGAANNSRLTYEYGKEVGRHCKRMGIHVNFAPDIDVNSNPNNPVIGVRSYGDSAEMVARLGIAYSKGLLSEGVLPVGKHFPGHGDVESDSHKTLPVNNKTREELNNEELLPFREYIKAGMPSLMVGHLYIPALDSVSGLPTSLSPVVVDKLLKQEMGYKGLLFTDALEMKGATAENSALKALLAGNHILLKPLDVGECIKSIEEAYNKGLVKEELLQSVVKKILLHKYVFVGKDRNPISEKGLICDIVSPEAERIIYKINSEAVTLLKNRNNIVPLRALDKTAIEIECYGTTSSKDFTNRVKSYGINGKANSNDKVSIIGIYSGKSNVVAQVEAACKDKRYILVFFTSPYNMKLFSKVIEGAEAVIMGYEETKVMQECAAELIMGGIAAKGKLPVNAAPYKRGDGIETKCVRLGYAPAEVVGMNSSTLLYIDSIIACGLKKRAFPGCQVLLAKDGKIVYEKAFGKRAGKESRDVTLSDIYDLASVTKSAATMPAIMHLHEQGVFNVDTTLRNYIPLPDTSLIGEIPMSELLWHQSGLPSGINPYYLLTDSNSYNGKLYHWRKQSPYLIQIDKQVFANNQAKLRQDLLREKCDSSFTIKISERLWANNAIRDTLLNRIARMEPDTTKKKYRYSDINFVLLQEVAERLSGSRLDLLTDSLFYAPLGMTRTTFCPMKKFNRWEVIPTERDDFLRKELMCGYPHDETACILGGVSGNAGLFGTANDLAKLLQMFLNGGSYGGEHYLNEESITLFTQTQSDISRRALGFDKPDLENEEKSPCCPEANATVYGHTGYTGTCFWVDKKNNMIFIFLSNRVFPHRWNKELMKMNIRPKIQNIAYEALKLF